MQKKGDAKHGGAKMKELGFKPKKKAIHVEEGKEDCGDDVSGLGKDITLFSYDVYEETASSDEKVTYLQVPRRVPGDLDTIASVYFVLSSPCYGHKG